MNSKYAEAKLGQDMIRHRIQVDGWDGKLWTDKKKPKGIVSIMCRLLIEMDGGAMWSGDLLSVDGETPKAMHKMQRLGLVEVIETQKGKGNLLMCTEEADKFLEKYDIGQGWLDI